MITRFAVRKKNHNKFIKVISLRRQGHSYSEIMKLIPVAKSTINNWITLVGLNLSQGHLQIQSKKRLENYKIGTIASRITRDKRKEVEIQHLIDLHKKHFNDPFYNFGIALYESEGSKGTECRFSNSDYRMVLVFVRFIETYFFLRREENMTFELFIHETRKNDLNKIKNFWINKVQIPKDKIKIYWKKNRVVRRRENPDYVGQVRVRVKGEKILGSKLSAISDIILRKYQRMMGGRLTVGQ